MEQVASQQAHRTVVSSYNSSQATSPFFLLSSSRLGLSLTLSQDLTKTFLRGHSLTKLFHGIYLLLFSENKQEYGSALLQHLKTFNCTTIDAQSGCKEAP